jgi:hypothetical protein
MERKEVLKRSRYIFKCFSLCYEASSYYNVIIGQCIDLFLGTVSISVDLDYV